MAREKYDLSLLKDSNVVRRRRVTTLVTHSYRESQVSGRHNQQRRLRFFDRFSKHRRAETRSHSRYGLFLSSDPQKFNAVRKYATRLLRVEGFGRNYDGWSDAQVVERALKVTGLGSQRLLNMLLFAGSEKEFAIAAFKIRSHIDRVNTPMRVTVASENYRNHRVRIAPSAARNGGISMMVAQVTNDHYRAQEGLRMQTVGARRPTEGPQRLYVSPSTIAPKPIRPTNTRMYTS